MPTNRSRILSMTSTTIGFFLVGTLALSTQDVAIGRAKDKMLDDNIARRFDVVAWGRQGTVLELLGGPLGVGAVSGSFYIGGLALGNQKAKTTAIAALEAVSVSALATGVLKISVGRRRPITVPGDANYFKPFSGNTSFPSGHTAAAFAMAAAIADQYDSLWIKGLSFGLAGLVGVGRVIQDRHWASDVVAGAVLGYESAALAKRFNFIGNKKLASDGRGLYFNWFF